MVPYRKGSVRVTSLFGRRTLNGETAEHRGIDLTGSDKTVIAVLPGRVLFSRMVDRSTGNRTWEWGNYICIRTDDGTLCYYCHLAKRAVQAGDTVEAGQVIGTEGSTGYSTGSHLHFEIRDGNGNSLDPSACLGIENRIQTLDAGRMYHRDMVCLRCGLEAKTKAYLDSYPFAADLWRKLWEAMESCGG